MPWAVALAKRRYSSRFDIHATELWFRGTVLRNPLSFLPIRNDGAFCIAMLSANPWLPTELHALNAMICAEDGKMWDALALLRECVEWGKRRGCLDWSINSDTPIDVGPLARRLGAWEEKGRYKLSLT